MAVDGEWAWPRCIGCGKDLKKKRPRDFRYGMDVCCANCINTLGRDMKNASIAWRVRSAAGTLKHYQKSEARGDVIYERSWHALAKDYALAWAHLRNYCLMPPLPAGLELFMIEIHNVRGLSEIARLGTDT